MLILRFGGFSGRWSGESQGDRRQKSRRAALRSQPWVAALEERALLSTLTVTNDNDSGTGSLRGALAAAVAGDSIKFAHSAYGTITLSSGPLEIQSNVKINGPGAKNVTINGNHTFQDLLVAANVTASVSGLTITGGKGGSGFGNGGGGISNYGTLTVDGCTITNNAAGYDGGGIQNDGSLTVTNSVVSNNTSGSGGGIFNNSAATLNIGGSTIKNNSAVSFGGGFENLGTATVTGSVVSNNSASSGGGIDAFLYYGPASGQITITNSSISNNSAPYNGGGIEDSNCPMTITGSVFANNSAGRSGSLYINLGGAIDASGSQTVTIAGSQFTGNTAVAADSGYQGGALGGAIYMSNFGASPNGHLNISNSAFQGNSVVGANGFGGAIDIEVGVTVSVTGTLFNGNSATADFDAQGGAVNINLLSFQEQSSFSHCTFQGNTAIVPATASIPFGDANGGALATDIYGGTLDVSGTTFIANQAVGGPGGGFGAGGAIYQIGPNPLNLSNTLLANNIASCQPSGGGALAGGLYTSGIVTATNTVFTGNQAIGGAASGAGNQAALAAGGGILNFGTMTLTNCTLAGNESIGGAATNGATAGNGMGGAVDNEGALTVMASGIIGNEAEGGAGGGNGYGGGIYSGGVVSSATLTLIDTLVTLNQADGGSGGGQGIGGGLYIAAGTATLTGKTKVVLNFATTSNNNIFGTYST
jgi:fibronectin-binding autotransporter adhesin